MRPGISAAALPPGRPFAPSFTPFRYSSVEARADTYTPSGRAPDRSSAVMVRGISIQISRFWGSAAQKDIVSQSGALKPGGPASAGPAGQTRTESSAVRGAPLAVRGRAQSTIRRKSHCRIPADYIRRAAASRRSRI